MSRCVYMTVRSYCTFLTTFPLMRIFHHSVTQRNATQRNARSAAAVPQPLVERKRSCDCDWSSSLPALCKKIELVSIWLRSTSRCRKRRCGVCGCVKKYALRKTFLLRKNFCVALRCIALRNAGKRALSSRQRWQRKRKGKQRVVRCEG